MTAFTLACRALLTALLLIAAAGTAPAAVDDTARDPRLDRETSARVVDRPLRDWLAEVSRETGVRLRTGVDYEDRAITMRVDKVPLRDLMRAVGALYGDVWVTRGKSSEPEYVLEASGGRKRLQAACLQAYKRSIGAELVELAREVAQNGPPPWMMEGGDERFGEEVRSRARILAELSPDDVSQLLSGEGFRVPIGEARGKIGAALRSFAEEFAMPASTGWTDEERARAWVHFSSETYSLPRFALQGLPLQNLHFSFGGRHGRSSAYNMVAHPDELAGRLEAELQPLERGQEQSLEERKRRGGALLSRRVPEATRELRAGPPLSRSLLLVTLAEELGANLLADSHTKGPLPRPELANRTLEEALTRVSALSSSRWRVDGPCFLVRSRYWWLDDPAEPPASQAARWHEALERRGFLSLPESATVAALSPAQQQRLSVRIPEARAAFSPWLRFYNALDARLREAAGSENGLELGRVPEQQRLLLLPRHADDPELGNENLENLIRSAGAIFRAREESPAGTVGPSVIFELRPLARSAGPGRPAGGIVRIQLPRRSPGAGGKV